MSENVRAIIDDAGFPEANVYRMSPDAIGICLSLAEAAQNETYKKYLREAGEAKKFSARHLHKHWIGHEG